MILIVLTGPLNNLTNPSEKGSTLNRMNLLPLGAKFFLLE